MIALQIVRQIGADGGQGKINLRAKFAVGVLQAEPERIRTFPVDQQQVIAPIAVDVQNLDGLDRAGEGYFERLAEGMVGLLGQEIKVVLAQQDQIGQLASREIAGGQRIGRQLAVADRPTFWRAPIVAALVVEHHQFLRVAVIGQVRPAVAVQVRHRQRVNSFFRRD